MSLAFDRVGGPLAPYAGALDVILAQQQANGAIPWFDKGPWDPWNHAECLMALYVAATDEATAALRAAIDPHSDWQAQVEQAMAAYLAALSSRPVLLRTLFIDILGLGATGLAVRRRVHGQLAELLLEVVNQRPGARLRKSPPLCRNG